MSSVYGLHYPVPNWQPWSFRLTFLCECWRIQLKWHKEQLVIDHSCRLLSLHLCHFSHSVLDRRIKHIEEISYNVFCICVCLSSFSGPDRDPTESRWQSGRQIVLGLLPVQPLGSGADSREPEGGAQDVPILRLQWLPQRPPVHGQIHPGLQTRRVRRLSALRVWSSSYVICYLKFHLNQNCSSTLELTDLLIHFD